MGAERHDDLRTHGLTLRWQASSFHADLWSHATHSGTSSRGHTGGPHAEACGDLISIFLDPAPAPSDWHPTAKPAIASEELEVCAEPTLAGPYLLRYPDGPTFQVEPRRVRVHGADDLRPAEIAWYLLGPVLSFLLALRGEFVLHGSAVRGGATKSGTTQLPTERSAATGAVAFIGPSGAGKSTLAAAFAARGRAGVSDDLLVLTGDPWRVVPGTPRRLLWPDSVAHLHPGLTEGPRADPRRDRNAAGAASPCRWDKLAVGAAEWAPPGPLPLTDLFYLRPAAATALPAARTLPAPRAVAALLGNVRLSWLTATDADGGRRQRNLERVSRLVEERPLVELTVPRDFRRLPAVLDLVEEVVGAARPAAAAAPTTAAGRESPSRELEELR